MSFIDDLKQLQEEHRSGPKYPWHMLVVGFIVFAVGTILMLAAAFSLKDTSIGSTLSEIEKRTQPSSGRYSGFGLISYLLLIIFTLAVAKPLFRYYQKRFPYKENRESILHKPVSWTAIVIILTALILGPVIVALIYDWSKSA